MDCSLGDAEREVHVTWLSWEEWKWILAIANGRLVNVIILSE
jgi:hypothetical protein